MMQRVLWRALHPRPLIPPDILLSLALSTAGAEPQTQGQILKVALSFTLQNGSRGNGGEENLEPIKIEAEA